MDESKAAVISLLIIAGLLILGLNYLLAALGGGLFYMIARS